jgi:hypothetical protein
MVAVLPGHRVTDHCFFSSINALAREHYAIKPAMAGISY